MVLFLSNSFTSSSSHLPIQPVPVNLYYYHFAALMQIVNNTIPPRLVLPSHASNIMSMKYILELVYYLADLVPFKESEAVLNPVDRSPFARVIWVLPRGFQFPIEYGQQVTIPYLGTFWMDQFLDVDFKREIVWFQIGGIHMGNFDRPVPLGFLGVPFKSKHLPWDAYLSLMRIYTPINWVCAHSQDALEAPEESIIDLAQERAEQPSELDWDHRYKITCGHSAQDLCPNRFDPAYSPYLLAPESHSHPPLPSLPIYPSVPPSVYVSNGRERWI